MQRTKSTRDATRLREEIPRLARWFGAVCLLPVDKLVARLANAVKTDAAAILDSRMSFVVTSR
jgi:hypothetical protein